MIFVETTNYKIYYLCFLFITFKVIICLCSPFFFFKIIIRSIQLRFVCFITLVV